MTSQWPVHIVSAVLGLLALFRFKSDSSQTPRLALGSAIAAIALALISNSEWQVGFWISAVLGALSWWLPNFGLLQASLLVLSGASLQIVGEDNPDLKLAAPALLAAAGALVGVFNSFVKVPKLASWFVCSAIVAAVAYFSLRGLDDGMSLAISAILGAAGGGICGLLFIEEGEPGNLRVAISSILWVGIASVAYAYGRAPGMALACTAGLSSAAAIGSGMVITSILPLLAMVLLRATFIQVEGVTRTFEISQHHSMIGLLIGLIAGVLPAAWAKTVTGWRRALGMILWLFVGVAAAGVTYPFLGQRGVMGFVAGIAVIPLAGGLSSANFNELGGAGATLACSVLLLAEKLSDTLTSSKDEKSKLLYISIGVILALAAVLGVLGRNSTEKNEA